MCHRCIHWSTVMLTTAFNVASVAAKKPLTAEIYAALADELSLLDPTSSDTPEDAADKVLAHHDTLSTDLLLAAGKSAFFMSKALRTTASAIRATLVERAQNGDTGAAEFHDPDGEDEMDANGETKAQAMARLAKESGGQAIDLGPLGFAIVTHGSGDAKRDAAPLN